MNETPVSPEASPPQDMASYYLIAGQVAFEIQGIEQIQVLALNSLVKLPVGHPFNAKAIGLAQQGLQAMVFNRINAQQPGTKFKTVDLVILNIIPLGPYLPGQFEEGSMLTQTPEQAGMPVPSKEQHN